MCNLLKTDASSIDLHASVNVRVSMSELPVFNPSKCIEVVHWKHVDLPSIENYFEKSTSKQRRLFAHWYYVEQENVELTWIFRTAKLRLKSMSKITSIFCSLILRRRKDVETTWIFRPSKLHRKNTSKRSGNTLIFSFRRIDTISTSNRRQFHVLCPLGWFCNIKS